MRSQLREDTWTITVEGELDLTTAPDVEEGVDDAAAKRRERLVLDLGRLEFMDSAGVHLLLRLRERYGRERLAVRRPSGCAGRVIEIADVEPEIGFAD